MARTEAATRRTVPLADPDPQSAGRRLTLRLFSPHLSRLSPHAKIGRHPGGRGAGGSLSRREMREDDQMAQVNQRAWKAPGQRAKRKAWGFTAQINGRQIRRYKTEWTQDDAERELAAALQMEPERPNDASITLAAAAERYLGLKARKRTFTEDKRTLEHLKAAFGETTLLAQITADRISKYKARRLATTRTIGATEKLLSAAAVNRPLALLRHLLRLAHDEWGVLDRVPKIRTEKEPQGRSGGSRGSRRPTCWPPAVRARTRHWPTSWSSACSRACAEVRRSRSLGIGSTAREASSAWS